MPSSSTTAANEACQTPDSKPAVGGLTSERWGLWRLRARKLADAARHGRLGFALRDGLVASVEHDYLSGARFAQLLDVGANKGQFSLFALEQLGVESIIAFEPLPSEADVYSSCLKHPSVTLRRVAVGSETGKATLHISAAPDSSSLLTISELQEEIFPGTAETGSMEVDVVTLDESLAEDTILHPNLLKIDVQGGELDVLSGAEATLSRVDAVLVECSFVELYTDQPLVGEIIECLSASGFVLVGVHNAQNGMAGRTVQADLFFEKHTNKK